MRGKTGRVYGALMAVLTTMKALSLSYNGDLDELAAPYFDAVDTVTEGLARCSTVMADIRWRTDRMADAAIEAAGPEVNELLARHDVHGGTAVTRVSAAIGAAYEKVEALSTWVSEKRTTRPTVEQLLA